MNVGRTRNQAIKNIFSPSIPFSNPTTNQEGHFTPFQRWYKFKEAFSPSLVLKQIQACPKKPQTIVDPFGGSGTTALVASALGIKSHTIEVNPFLADLIETKTTHHDAQGLLLGLTQVFAEADLDKGRSLKMLEPGFPTSFVENIGKERWLFNRQIAERICSLRMAIERLGKLPEKLLLKILLGSCLLEVSNVLVNGKGRRYRSNWRERVISPNDLDELFFSRVSTAIEDISKLHYLNRERPQIIKGDARKKVNLLPERIDLALFSPPYPNSFDYTDIYNIELWMLGYLSKTNDNRMLRESTLRSHVQIKRDFGTPPPGSRTLYNTLKKLEGIRLNLWSRHIPDMVGGYFIDLDLIIGIIGGKLSKNGRIVMVVGDSRYGDVLIPVARILKELAIKHRLIVESMHTERSMRTSPQQGGDLTLEETSITFVLG